MRFVLFVLAVAMAWSFSGRAGAQTSSPAPTQTAKKTTVRSVSGTVKSTSPETVVVAGRDKGRDAEWTFGVEPTTDIRKGTKSITAADLKPGEAVQIRFTEQDGKALARSIIVRAKSPAAGKKTKP
jgi:hypothetical protein